jgi:molybdopterin-containing oxidoreductase family iron-sulfur binding subunit
MEGKAPFDLASIRARLERDGGKQFWRSLEELAGCPEYTEFLHDEFPQAAEADTQNLSRRDVLKLMAASAALAGLSACTKLPTEKIVPYVKAPEEIIPGRPLFYATSMPQGGIAQGLLVESNMGRPTKVEGNPEHPGSLGATDIFAQASLLTLYDPDRSQVVKHEGRIADWQLFQQALDEARAEQQLTKGAGLRILTGTITSPSLADQLQAVLAAFPQANWHQYEPCGRDGAREGAKRAFGEYVNAVYRLDRADVIVSLDSDFLCTGPGNVRYARDFADRRNVGAHGGKMNRLYVVESTPSNTGAMADHRLPVSSSDVEKLARAIAGQLGVQAGAIAPPARVPSSWIAALVRDLMQHRGASLVVAGEHQPAAVHALAHAINQALGNAGKTVYYTDPLEANPVNEMQSLRELVADMAAGHVDVLLILGGNPVYDAPVDLEFARCLLKVKLRIHLGLYDDETAELCHWHVAATHFLESWGDARAYDGTISLMQPLIAPLYDGKSAHEVLSALAGKPNVALHDIVKGFWKRRITGPALQAWGGNFEPFWETSLHDGLIAGTALPEKTVSLKTSAEALETDHPAHEGDARALELIFRSDPTIGDGQFANNGWLQELPKALTQLTWDNAAMVSPGTAYRLGLGKGEIVELHYQGRMVRAPIWVMPGHADDCVTVHFGYGRRRAGKVGNGIGFNAYSLRSSDRPWFGGGLRIQKTGEWFEFATTQFHHSIEVGGRIEDEGTVVTWQRDLVRVAPLEEFLKNPEFAKDHVEKGAENLSLLPDYPKSQYGWGMSIDLNRCNGCSACVVACQAENNIPVVGKEQVIAGREMHWIRVDTYFRGGLGNPEMYHEPVPCMQCEKAPCELVCPVGATVHSPEGLNDMVYNRCVGTRYCSNNCPYKVRRFNFFLYQDWTTPSLKLLRNPNVTVRSRGVMEKCTYCVQRINAAKIESEKQDRAVRDGEIQTACQQVCPTQAIVFGDINDPNSRVSRLKAEPRNYSLLAELNTRPRTTYLAKLRNPNPEIKD